MENEDQISKKLDLADTWLTKLGVILKKHWGKLLLLLFAYFIYWALTSAPVEEYPPVNEYREPYPAEVLPDSGSYYEEEDTLNYDGQQSE